MPLTPRQRAAFIMMDGHNTVDQVLAATRGTGVVREDIEHLLQLGLVEEATPPRAAPASLETGAAPAHEPGAASHRTPQERYQAGYQIATRLTAGLGLRGLRLNLAVEHATSYERLCEVAPRIKDAVGRSAYLELHQALFG